MRRIWQACLAVVAVLRELFNRSNGFIVSIGAHRDDKGKLHLLLRTSQWDKEVANQIKAAHKKQLAIEEPLHIEKKSRS